MHAVRRSLVEAQAERIGLPLWAADLPWPCSNAEYEKILRGVCQRAMEEGIEAVAFGDLFLADIRSYRELPLRGTGLEPLFPLWQIPTAQLAREIVSAGVKAKLTCVDTSKLDKSYAGRDFDLGFLEGLRAEIDPWEITASSIRLCTTLLFPRRIDVQIAEIVAREGFVFADVTSS